MLNGKLNLTEIHGGNNIDFLTFALYIYGGVIFYKPHGIETRYYY